MSPTARAISEACFVDERYVSLAVSHLRAVKPRLFDGIPQVEVVVSSRDKAPYNLLVDDYPPSLVFGIVNTLKNMGSNENCRTKELIDFAKRMKYRKVDLRVLYQKQGSVSE